MKKFTYSLLVVFALLLIAFLAIPVIKTPSNDREWANDHKQLASVSLDGDNITVNNVRDFIWQDATNIKEANYTTRSFAIRDIEGFDIVISHFSDIDAIAHVFINFHIKNQDSLSLSIEARREMDEQYSPFLSAFAKHELIYVFANPSDVVDLRTKHRNERVYSYSVDTSSQQAQKIFIALSQDANNVATDPVWYNTLTANCTNLVTKHMEVALDTQFSNIKSAILPGRFQEELTRLGLLKQSSQLH